MGGYGAVEHLGVGKVGGDTVEDETPVGIFPQSVPLSVKQILHKTIKMDFLVQELNREANTIGSKAQDVEIARRVIDIKAEVEKIREQVQNIE